MDTKQVLLDLTKAIEDDEIAKTYRSIKQYRIALIESIDRKIGLIMSESQNPISEPDTKALNLQRVRLSLLNLDTIKQQAKAYAKQYKTQASSEGLENIADDFENGVKWALEFIRNEA